MEAFRVGKEFHSFEELDESVKKFGEQTCCKFWKREARTINAVANKIKRPLKESLIYYELKYACIHGGQSFRPTVKGVRDTSLKKNCPVHVSVRASADGNSLIVRSFYAYHNHDPEEGVVIESQQMRSPVENKSDQVTEIVMAPYCDSKRPSSPSVTCSLKPNCDVEVKMDTPNSATPSNSTNNTCAKWKKAKQSDDVRRRAPKVNLRQMEAMVDFMSQRPDFATSFKADYQSEQLWETLGQVLAEFGPEKHINQWKKLWKDMKYKARARKAALTLQRKEANNTSSPHQTVLSRLDQRVLSLWDEYGCTDYSDSMETESPVLVSPIVENKHQIRPDTNQPPITAEPATSSTASPTVESNPMKNVEETFRKFQKFEEESLVIKKEMASAVRSIADALHESNRIQSERNMLFKEFLSKWKT